MDLTPRLQGPRRARLPGGPRVFPPRGPGVVPALALCGTMSAFSAVLGIVRTASAEVPPMSLTWNAPAECPDEAFVRDQIEHLLAEGPRPTPWVEAHAVVSRTPDGRWRVHIVTVRDGATGERSIEAASCRPLAEATALIVVLAVDPARGAAPVEGAATIGGGSGGLGPGPATTSTSPAPPAPAPPTTAAGPPATRAPLEPRPPDAANLSGRPGGVPVHVAVFASAGGDIGTLPEPAMGAALNAAVVVKRLRLEVYGVHWFDRSKIVQGPTADYGGTISLSAGGGAGCFVVPGGRFELAPCVAFELGDLHGAGAAVDVPSTRDGWWVAVVGAIHGTMQLVGPLWAGLRLEGIVPLIRDRFVVDINEQTSLVFRSPPIAGRAFLGPELRF